VNKRKNRQNKAHESSIAPLTADDDYTV